VLILCWFAYVYQNGTVDRGLFFNSDALFFPSLFKNIFLEGKNFADWVLPPSAYLFPDAILYAIAYLLNKNVFSQILIFAVLQSILFFYLTNVLLRFFIRSSYAITFSALISSNIILMGLYSADPYGYSFIGVFHFGSLLSFLMLAVLLLKYLSATSTKEKYSAGATTILLATLSVLSDRIILVQFVAPILVIGIYAYYTDTKSRQILKFAMFLIIGYPIAILIGKFFLPEMARLDSGIGFGSVSSKLTMLAIWVINKPWLTQFSITLIPVSLIVASLYLHKNRKDIDQLTAQKRLVALLILISAALMLIVTGLSDRDFTPRYLLPYIFLAPVFLFILSNVKYFRVLVLIIFCSTYAAKLANPVKENTSIQFYKSYPEFVRCVDDLAQKYGISRGIAQYWDAIPLHVFSSAGLNVVPVIDDGSPMRFEYNTSEFSGEFSFAVIDNSATGLYKISRTAIEQRLSKKPIEYQCFDKTVLIFNNEKISLPRQSALSGIRSSTLESFVKNPRALLIMAQEESAKGNHEAVARLITEAISLLRQSGARDITIEYYESIMEKSPAEK
jgi:hypothetical protein